LGLTGTVYVLNILYDTEVRETRVYWFRERAEARVLAWSMEYFKWLQPPYGETNQQKLEELEQLLLHLTGGLWRFSITECQITDW
jgi:hypothetical protein